MSDEAADALAATDVVRRHEGLLGTVIEVRIRCANDPDDRRADRIDTAIVDEVARLESVFSMYDESSELSRWKRDEIDAPSDDFVAVMRATRHWHEVSEGRFNPMTGLLTAVWTRAAVDGRRPSARELDAVAESIADPRFEVTDDGRVHRTGDCAGLNVNAIAKGYIVDRAVAAARATDEPALLVVNAGGDLVHRGTASVRVGIENPLRPYDNEPPLVVVDLADGGLATSGGARRGFRVGGERLGHVIDPRTGEPVTAQASISVVADDAMTADVLATVLGMSEPDAAIDEAGAFPTAGCMVVGPDGSVTADATWAGRFGESGIP